MRNRNKLFTMFVFLKMVILLISIVNVDCQPPLSATEQVNKSKKFKTSFVDSTKYCSSLHQTSLIQVIALFGVRELDDHEGKCFFHCMLQRYRLMDKQGKYNEEKFKPFMDRIPESNFLSSIKNNVKTCLKEDAEDPCEKAFKFVRCFYKNGAAKKTPGEEEVLPAEGF